MLANVLAWTLAVLSTAEQPPGTRPDAIFFYGNVWDSKEYRLGRPASRLSDLQAEAWIEALKKRGMVGAVGQFVSVKSLIETATADREALKNKIVGPNTSDRLIGLAEAIARRDKSLLTVLEEAAIKGNPNALSAAILMAPDQRRSFCLEVFKRAQEQSIAKDQAAFGLLSLGDTRGVHALRNAQENKRSFGKSTGAGWYSDPILSYYFVRYADAKNAKLIASDLSRAHDEIRYYFPTLAKLKRPAIDKALLSFASSKDFHWRKWIAIAAKERADSPAYRNTLLKLAGDQNKDVRAASLWALGKGPMPDHMTPAVDPEHSHPEAVATSS